MNIINFDKWKNIAQKIIHDFVLQTEMYTRDNLGLYDRVENPIDFLQRLDDSRMYSVFYHLYTGGRTDWAEELTGELENKLIEECYKLNPGFKNIYDFEDEFIGEHFKVEKQYIYDLLFGIDKNDLIKILQSEH